MQRQLVVFQVATEHFAVDIQHVDGIIKMQPITRVPQAADFFEGVTHLRGEVLPVMNLRRRFDLGQRGDGPDVRIVIVLLEGQKVGMIVDAVSEVQHVALEAIDPSAALLMGDMNTNFIEGIAQLDDRLILLLALDKVLNIEEEALCERA